MSPVCRAEVLVSALQTLYDACCNAPRMTAFERAQRERARAALATASDLLHDLVVGPEKGGAR